MSDFNAYHKWLGLSVSVHNPHYYRLLGLPAFETDLDVIEIAAEQRLAFVGMQVNGPYRDQADSLIKELSQARNTLLTPATKKAYDAQLSADSPDLYLAHLARESTNSARSTDSFDPYHHWLGIPPHAQPADHYRILGLRRFESDVELIEAAAELRMAYLHGCTTGPNVASAQQLLNELASARLCLLDPHKRRQYNDQLGGHTASTPDAQPDHRSADQSHPVAPLETDETTTFTEDLAPRQPSLRRPTSSTADLDGLQCWLGIPRDDQPPNHYRLLGIPLFEDDPLVLEAATAGRAASVRPFIDGPYAEKANAILSQISAAAKCLRNPKRKLAYDQRLVIVPRPESKPQAGPNQTRTRPTSERDLWNVCLAIPLECRPPDHYRLLGISRFETSNEAIEAAASQRSARVAEFLDGDSGQTARHILDCLETARRCLTSPSARGKYDRILQDVLQHDWAGTHPFASHETPDRFDPWMTWLGIPPHARPADHYRLLGLPRFEADEDKIQMAATRQSTSVAQHLHGPHHQECRMVLQAIARALRCLKEMRDKDIYDRRIRIACPHSIVAPLPASPPAPPRPLQSSHRTPRLRPNQLSSFNKPLASSPTRP